MHPWILLRGLTRECAHWGTFAQAFQNALPLARAVAIDLPGNGLRYRERSPTTVREMVESCRVQLAVLGLRPPFALLAMSLGAMVATEWARVAPGELARCVLINTSLRPFSPFYQRLRPGNYPAVLRCALPWASPQAVENAVLRLTSNRADAHGPALQDWLAIRRARPVQPGNSLRQLFAAARYTAPAVAPLGPDRILLLASRNDRLVSSQCSETIAHAWQAPLRVHPWAGHDLPLDDAEWVIRQVTGWITDPARPARSAR